MTQIFLWIFIFFLIFVLLILSSQILSPPINKKTIDIVGREIMRLFKIENKIITFKISKKIKSSQIHVLRKHQEYLVEIKDTDYSRKLHGLIHELTHIKTGHSDRFRDYDKLSFFGSSLGILLVKGFAEIPAIFNEVWYFNKRKEIYIRTIKNFRKASK